MPGHYAFISCTDEAVSDSFSGYVFCKRRENGYYSDFLIILIGFL